MGAPNPYQRLYGRVKSAAVALRWGMSVRPSVRRPVFIDGTPCDGESTTRQSSTPVICDQPPFPDEKNFDGICIFIFIHRNGREKYHNYVDNSFILSP